MTVVNCQITEFVNFICFRFLNSNSDLVFNELKESYEKALSSVFQNVTNEIFDRVPMNKIFLED